MKKQLNEVRRLQKLAGLKEYISPDPETVAQAFVKAGIDMNKPVTVVQGDGMNDKKSTANPNTLAAKLQKIKDRQPPEEGVTFDYEAPEIYSAQDFEGMNIQGVCKLSVMVSDAYEFIIFQEDATAGSPLDGQRTEVPIAEDESESEVDAKMMDPLAETPSPFKNQVAQAIKNNFNELATALKARKANQEDIDAHDEVKATIIKTAQEAGIKDAQEWNWMEDEMFSGTVSAKEAISYLKDYLEGALEDMED